MREVGYIWTDEMLKPADDSPIDSPINSDIHSPMTAKELLQWLSEHYGDGEYRKVFGADYCFTELMAEYEDNVGEIVQKIEQYEAAKKAPRPVEVECGYRCSIYQKDDIESYELWGVSEEAAREDAKAKAIKKVKETGKPASIEVVFTCREDKSCHK